MPPDYYCRCDHPHIIHVDRFPVFDDNDNIINKPDAWTECKNCGGRVDHDTKGNQVVYRNI